MAEDFKVVNLVVELSNVVTAEITKLSLSKPIDSTHSATPTYITFLLIEAISDNFKEALMIAKKPGNLSIAERYFNNSSAHLIKLEQVLCEFSMWLSTYQKPSLFIYPVNVREFINYLVAINLHPAEESKNPDSDIKLLHYGDSPPSAQYTNRVLYCFEQLKAELQANRSVLEKSSAFLASIENIKNISIRARMVVAIECISKEVNRFSLQHTDVNKFIEFFWSFVEQDDLGGWDRRLRSYDELCDVWNHKSNQQLSKDVASIPEHIREMFRYAIELGDSELYGAVSSYSPCTYQNLLDVLRILAYTSGEIVNLSVFQKSPIDENYGWGFHHHRSWFTVSEQ